MPQRWVKGGLLANAAGSPEWMTSHLAVPTVHPRADGGLDVYVSSRDRHDRSHSCRFALPPDWPVVSVTPEFELLLAPGAPGEFDDGGAMTTWLHEVNDSLRLYYIGWNRGVTVPFRNALGVAVSTDGGATFVRSPGPILDRGPHDPCFVASCCILAEEGRFRMWYVSGLRWEHRGGSSQPWYHIKHASSPDGLEWERDGTVCIDFASETEHAISRPWVIREDGVYRMWYSHRGTAYRIGYAESEDGLTWTRLDDEVGLAPSASGWDAATVAYPCVFDHGGSRYMLYNGDGYGRTGVGWAVLG
jgi:hypothetical protein